VSSLVCAFQAVLALYASKRTSGIIVHIGFNVTSVVPSKFPFLFRSELVCAAALNFFWYQCIFHMRLGNISYVIYMFQVARIDAIYISSF
jgi:hypothetical protein